MILIKKINGCSHNESNLWSVVFDDNGVEIKKELRTKVSDQDLRKKFTLSDGWEEGYELLKKLIEANSEKIQEIKNLVEAATIEIKGERNENN